MDVIRIIRLFREPVMDVMRNHIDFFGDDFNHKIPTDRSHPSILEAKRSVRGISVQPESAVTAQDHHAVEQTQEEKWPTEIMGKKES
jgi:hypothetical protein